MAEGPDKDAKTEDATPRRRQEARKNGQVALSNELVAAMMLMAGLGGLMFAGDLVAITGAELMTDMIGSLGQLGAQEFDVQGSTVLLKGVFVGALTPLLVVMVPGILMGLLIGYGQVGFVITPKAIEVSPSKIDPVSGAKKLFSARSVMRTTLSGAKLIGIAAVMTLITLVQIEDIARVSDADLGPILAALGQVALKTTLGGLVTILLLALIDLIYQRYQHEKDLRMSKEEIKEENRIAEGDPKVKAKIRQIQRDQALKRMMADVPKATVVVTNPTHYAVALRYESSQDGESRAPICVAKGKGPIARRIKEIARDNGIVLYEDVPLARALHAQVDVGNEIPEELYSAVAEVLAYVYRLQERAAAAV